MSTQNHPLEILSSHATSARFLAPQIVQTAPKQQPSIPGTAKDNSAPRCG